jgi:nicotinamidase-related amidase
MNIALIIIDMQVGLFENTARFDAQGVIQRINTISKTIRVMDGIVIFVQHEDEDAFASDSNGWKILPDLEREDKDWVIHKQACDAFYQTNLADTLAHHGIQRLIITGCATDFCVDTTVRAAASRDYKITVAQDAHTAADRPHLKAEKIIQHHNYIWKNLILPQSKVQVLSTATIIQNLQKEQT